MSAGTGGFLFGLSSLFDLSLSGWRAAYLQIQPPKSDAESMAEIWGNVEGYLNHALGQEVPRGEGQSATR